MAYSHPKTLSVVGFQFEPERSPGDKNSPDNYNDVRFDNGEITTEPRNHLDVSTWCKCGQCQNAATEKECICCVDVDEIATGKLKFNAEQPRTQGSAYLLFFNFYFL